MLKEFIEEQTIKIVNQIYKNLKPTEKLIQSEYKELSSKLKVELIQFFNINSIDGVLSTDRLYSRMTNEEYLIYKSRISQLSTLLLNPNLNPSYRQQIEILQRIEPLNSLDAFMFLVEGMFLMTQSKINEQLQESLVTSHEDAYYGGLFVLDMALVGVTLVALNKVDVVKSVLSPWKGLAFYERLNNIKTTANNKIRQLINSNKSIQPLSRELQSIIESSYSNTMRIAKTETAHSIGEGITKGYESSNVVKKYQFLATLDNRTSKICQSTDGKVFLLKDREVGVNSSPLHPNCRSTEIPYFDDRDISKLARIARNKSGNNMFVPAKTNYAEWKSKFNTY